MRLLVIEDYGPLRRSLARGLRREGYAVDAVADGVEGLEYATAADYDVIILDLMLPRLDGLSLLRRLRAAGSSARVLILTARDAVADRVRGLEAGADDYLVKPFAFAELRARVKTLARRRYEMPSPILRCGPLKIDTTRRSITCGGDSIDLTAREYALLELLAVRAGQVVPRETIADHLYDFDSEVGSNVIDVYISRLRRKLAAAGAEDLIQTRRGIGYSLGAPPR